MILKPLAGHGIAHACTQVDTSVFICSPFPVGPTISCSVANY